MSFEAPAWWPPKVGDRLRHFTQHSAGDMRIKDVEALNHVVSVFEHEGETRIVVAEWFPGRQRWHYEVLFWANVAMTEFGPADWWPDGEARPQALPRSP